MRRCYLLSRLMRNYIPHQTASCTFRAKGSESILFLPSVGGEELVRIFNPHKSKQGMLVWPIVFLTIAMMGFVTYTYVTMEKTTIMKDWNANRCGVFVMFAAGYFKPDMDPRTASEFAMDNMRYCMGSLSSSIMSTAMIPLNTALDQQWIVTDAIALALTKLRMVMKAIMDAFMSYIQPFFEKFKNVGYQISIIVQHLKTAFQRMNAILLTAVYTGLSLMTGLQNMMQFTFFVIMIILAIMVAIIILLFFILFPFIPILITPVILIIIAGATAAMAGTASSMRGMFCFVPETQIVLQSGTVRPISEIRVGDVLEGGVQVDAVLQMDGTTTDLYDISGVHVSGSHLVQTLGGSWTSVSKDVRATPLYHRSSVLYCLNTRTRTIPINGLIFRDWEEIAEDDTIGQKGWNRHVNRILGGSSIPMANHMCLMDSTILIPTTTGLCPLDAIKIGDRIELSYNRATKVLGIVEGRVQGTDGSGWMADCIERNYMTTGYTRKNTLTSSEQFIHGRHLITDSGEMIVLARGLSMRIRDFTELGIDRIHETYSFVLDRLISSTSTE